MCSLTIECVLLGVKLSVDAAVVPRPSEFVGGKMEFDLSLQSVRYVVRKKKKRVLSFGGMGYYWCERSKMIGHFFF
jgi:hypothetical protein